MRTRKELKERIKELESIQEAHLWAIAQLQRQTRGKWDLRRRALRAEKALAKALKEGSE